MRNGKSGPGYSAEYSWVPRYYMERKKWDEIVRSLVKVVLRGTVPGPYFPSRVTLYSAIPGKRFKLIITCGAAVVSDRGQCVVIRGSAYRQVRVESKG